MKNIYLLSILLTLLSNVHAQISMFQDKKGETSIQINEKKLIGINSSDASITFGFSLAKTKYFWGLDSKLKAEDGVSNILDGYDFKPSIVIGLTGGFPIKTKNESTTHYVYSGVSFNNAYFNLFKNDSTNTYNEKSFTGYKIFFGYNRISSVNFLGKDGLESSYIFGISVNYKLLNNLEDIKSVTRYSSIIHTTDSTQNILQYDKKSGYLGEYSIDNNININIDAYLYPQLLGGQIALGGYWRSQLTGNKPRNNIGFGALIGKEDAPTDIVLGIMYQFNDVFNQLDKENEFIKRGGISLIAGYKF